MLTLVYVDNADNDDNDDHRMTGMTHLSYSCAKNAKRKVFINLFSQMCDIYIVLL